MEKFVNWLANNYLVLVAIIIGLIDIILYFVHKYGRDHKVPTAEKVEQKRKRKELKAAYKAACKALDVKGEKQDEKKK